MDAAIDARYAAIKAPIRRTRPLRDVRSGAATIRVMLLGDLFDLSLRGRADAAGLICEVAGRARELSFGEIADRAARVAAALRRRGLEPGDRLAVQLPNRLEFIDLFLACVQSGLVLVPINVLYREREIAHMVADSAPRWKLTVCRPKSSSKTAESRCWPVCCCM